jgi:hypothetical protein
MQRSPELLDARRSGRAHQFDDARAPSLPEQA